jgi:hypothetical protein
LNGGKYREIIDESLLQRAQDNNLKHSAKTTQEWLQAKSLNVLEWPSQSLDLNPISLERPENSCAETFSFQPDSP